MIADRIYAYLDHPRGDPGVVSRAIQRLKPALERQFTGEQRDTFRLRPSNAGKCPRQLSFLAHGAPPEPMNSRTRLLFAAGDILEASVLALAELAGVDIGQSQATVDTIAGPGHIDAMMAREDGYAVVECKSMSGYGFDRFKAEGCTDMWGYRTQSLLYSLALDVCGTVVVAVDKETCNLHECWIPRDDVYVRGVVERAKTGIMSDPSDVGRLVDMKPLEHRPKLKKWELMDKRCTYCPVKFACWPTLECVPLATPVFRISELPAGVPVKGQA